MTEQLFSASIDSIILTDTAGLITHINPAAESMLGYSANELIGEHIKLIYATDEEFNQTVSVIEKTGLFKGEIINKRKDESKINVFLSANWLYDKANKPCGMMGISRDISANISLQNEYNNFIKTIPDIIYSISPNGHFGYISDSVKRMLGYEPKELLGSLFLDIISDTHKKYASDHYRSHIQKKLTNSYLEFQVIKKDSTLLWVGQHVSARYDMIETGKIIGFYGVVREIDAQKNTELLLTNSEEKYRDLFDNSTDLIQIVDQEGNINFVNNAWKKALGYTDTELKNLNLFSVIHPDSLNHCTILINDIISSGKCDSERVLYELISKKGEKIIVEGTVNIKLNNGNVEAIQSFLRDVTKQKEIEKQLVKQEQTLRQITETLSDVFFLYNVEAQKYEYISPNCENILGANDDFFYAGKSHTRQFGHPDDVEILLGAKKLVDKGTAYDINYRLVFNDKISWINEKSFPILDKNGNVVANSGICREITDLKNANDIIAKQNKEISSSILYAKRLQDSVLPTKKQITEIYSDSFVLYKPKDIVSGDFYIVDYIKTNEQYVMPAIVVGDCTGHGIPGAVLSLMCNVLIRESFTRNDINSPSEALDFVRKRLVKFFKSNSNKEIIRDGMDVAFCVLNKDKRQLYFSGAYNSCVLIRDNQILEYRGDKQHVGYNDNPVKFINHVIDIKVGDAIFLYTDGYIDQFGGSKNKKYSKKRLHQLLLNNSHLPMHDIERILEDTIMEWKGNEDQIDDITILGIRI